jgi:uncharacterized protein YkwD
VLGPSPRNDGRPPLSFAARAAIYALLAGLVVASFVVTPTAGAAKRSTDQATGRALPLARSIARGIRDLTDADQGAPELTATLVFEPRTQVAIVDEPTNDSDEMVPPTPTAAAEGRMLALINGSRAAGGLALLAMDDDVSAVARDHSAAESEVRYVYHDGVDGSAHARDATACGTSWYGENTGKIWNDNVDALHNEFMSEPWEPINHRTNIMGAPFRRVGIGAVIGPDAMYMTIVFCR